MTKKETFKDSNFLFVVNTLNGFGGAERQALILASYIKVNVSEHVTFIAFEDGTNFRSLLEEAGFQVYFFPFNHQASKAKKLLQYYKLVQYVKKLSPDILIPYVAESNKIVAQIWKHTGAKFAFWNQREEGRKLYGTPLEQKLIRWVSAIVSNSFEGADALIILTEWDEFRALDMVRVKKSLKSPNIIDLRNIYNPQNMQEYGFNYISVGR